MDILKWRFFCALIFTLFFNLTSYGYCTVYYVKNAGDDYTSGLSDQEAWKTISKINSFKFLAGDTVCLKRGSKFHDATLYSPNVDNFTLRDYGEGEKPHLDGDRVRPIEITSNKLIRNLTIRNIDISGQDWHVRKQANLLIRKVAGLTIDGVVGDGHHNGNKSKGKTAILIDECSDNIEVKNCVLYNWGPSDFLTIRQDFLGIALLRINEGTYEIHHNIVHNVNADCIHLYHCTAHGTIHHNRLYNAGEDSIDVKGTENCEIYENEFFRTADFTGEYGSGSGGIPTLIVVHGPTGKKAKNIVIRNNTFRDSDSCAIKMGNAENIEIYKNYFKNLSGAIIIQNATQNAHVHHNTFINFKSRKGYRDMDAGCIYENNSYSGTRIYNNTIYSSGPCKHLISIACCNKTEIKKNIVYLSNGDKQAFCLYYWPCGKDPIVQNNCWYNELSSYRVKYRNLLYTKKMLDSWRSIEQANDIFEDPLFNDPQNGDFSLKTNSPCLSGTEYWGAVPFSLPIQKSSE